MDMQRAAEYLRQLMAGVDPDTGEVLPEDHLMQRGDVREALLTALQAMGAQETTGGLPLNRSGRLNAGRPWTEKDRADLLSLYNSGVSIEEIARLTHRRPRGVRLQLSLMAGGGARRDERADGPETLGKEARHKHGLRWSPEDDAMLADMYQEGQSLKSLAAGLGRSERAVWLRLQRLGLLPDENDPDSPTRCWTPENTAELRQLHGSGLSVAEIAARMNRSEAAVNARLFYMGRGGRAPELFPAPEAETAAAPPPAPGVAAAVTPSRRWTEEDDACLRRAWARGDDVERIVRLMGRRDWLVRCRLVFLGLADRSLLGGAPVPPELAHQGLPWYPEEIGQLQRMFREGCTHEAMAAELKRSVGAIRSRLDMLGLTDAQD